MGEVRHLCDEQVFSRARRRFDNGGINLSGAMLRKNDALHACCLGGSHQRTEIIDILNSVEDEEEWSLVFAGSIVKDIVNRDIFALLDQGDAALVYSPVTDRVEAGTWYYLDGNMSPLGLFENGGESRSFSL